MQASNIALMLNSWRSKIRTPDENVFVLQNALEKVSDDKMAILNMIPLKSPVVGLLLGIFLGLVGADRFYKGDLGVGVAKLIFCIYTFGVWWIVDWFLVYKGIKEDNFNKIMQNIHYLTYH